MAKYLASYLGILSEEVFKDRFNYDTKQTIL